MAIDASITVIGPNKIEQWTCKDENDYYRARNSAKIFVSKLENAISKQLNDRFTFQPTLIGKVELDWDEIEPKILPIGDSSGLTWIQETIYDNLNLIKSPKYKREMADESKLDSKTISCFSHLLDHDPVSGLFLPNNFPEHFTIEHKGDIVSIGSLSGLDIALYKWLEYIDEVGVPKLSEDATSELILYSKNFALMTNIAMQYGLALELL